MYRSNNHYRPVPAYHAGGFRDRAMFQKSIWLIDFTVPGLALLRRPHAHSIDFQPPWWKNACPASQVEHCQRPIPTPATALPGPDVELCVYAPVPRGCARYPWLGCRQHDNPRPLAAKLTFNRTRTLRTTVSSQGSLVLIPPIMTDDDDEYTLSVKALPVTTFVGVRSDVIADIRCWFIIPLC